MKLIDNLCAWGRECLARAAGAAGWRSHPRVRWASPKPLATEEERKLAEELAHVGLLSGAGSATGRLEQLAQEAAILRWANHLQEKGIAEDEAGDPSAPRLP